MRVCVVWCLLLCCGTAWGQGYTTKSTASPKLQERYDRAMAYFKAERDGLAMEELQEILKKDSTFIDAQILAGFIFYNNGKPRQAIRHLAKATQLNPAYDNRTSFFAGKAMMETGNYAEAVYYLDLYTGLADIDADLKKKAVMYLRNCRFAAEAIKNPVPYAPYHMGDSVNSRDPEYLPCLTADGETIIFTRRVANRNEDFFYSRRKEGKWMPAQPIKDVNTPQNEGAESISADGNTLVFTGCDWKDGLGSCDLYICEKVAGKWTKAQNMGKPLNSSAWEAQPSLSADGQVVYFSSNRPGSLGSSDIWVSRKMPSGKWGSPVNLGDSINTAMEERCPFLHADNQTLYFSSNGHPSFGGHDFFFSRRLPTGRWDVPQNLGSPINTTGEEASLVISLDGKTAYFASERTENGAAFDPNLMDTDLYAFELYEGARPRPVTYVRATVYDAETRMPLVALAEVINLATTRRTTSDTTDAFGVFLICLPIGQDFALNVRKTGYLFHSENFKLSEGNTRDKPYLLDIYLMPIREADTTGTATGVPPAAKPVVLRNVFFDTGSATLRPESNIELDILKNLLVENPSLRIRLNGHTDNVGSDSDNLNLSSNRAKAVYDYLVTAGIAASRLNYKGFGETMPIDTNDTPEGRQNNRRTEFEVL